MLCSYETAVNYIIIFIFLCYLFVRIRHIFSSFVFHLCNDIYFEYNQGYKKDGKQLKDFIFKNYDR